MVAIECAAGFLVREQEGPAGLQAAMAYLQQCLLHTHSCGLLASNGVPRKKWSVPVRCSKVPTGEQIRLGCLPKAILKCSSRRRSAVKCVPVESSDEASGYPELHHETLEIDIGGKKLKLETGEIGRQANGAVLASDGETVIYCTACYAGGGNQHQDFIPLTIQYQEKFSAAGKTKGGFMKRDRAVDHEILTSRLVDRSLRPVVTKGWVQETQVLEWVVSYDGENSPEPLAITAASAALALSDVPLAKPVVGVRIGWTEAKGPIVHPTLGELEEGKLDLILAGSSDGVIMIEGYADFLPEEEMIKAIGAGTAAVCSASKQIAEWAARLGKKKNVEELIVHPKHILKELEDFCRPEVEDIFKLWEKSERHDLKHELWRRIKSQFVRNDGQDTPQSHQAVHEEFHVKNAFKKLQAKVVRDRILRDNVRIDGRSSTEIRPIYSRANVLARTHGSALFTRGCTQALCVTTLGGRRSAQRVNTIQAEDDLRFYLQYFFPPSSVGEVRRYGGMPGRRELGHGQLASRSLEGIVPASEDFPYTIRVESTITESDGSSSMASVCGGCLAMMDAGVPIKRPVAGIAMGLVMSDETGKFTVLSDILGTEDALGDMDFKVAGDGDGITGFQMDMKVENINTDIIAQALIQAKQGRIHILEQMAKCSPPPREALSEYAPALLQLQIDPERRGDVIGQRGKTVKEIMEISGADAIDVNDEGGVLIECNSMDKGLQAAEIIKLIGKDREIGEIFRGCEVVRIMSFGAFINLMPGMDGMLHISELAAGHVEKVEDVVNLGDIIDVQIVGISPGKIRLATDILESQEEIEKRDEERKEARAAMKLDSKKSYNGRRGDKNFKYNDEKKKNSSRITEDKVSLPPVVLKAGPSKGNAE